MTHLAPPVRYPAGRSFRVLLMLVLPVGAALGLAVLAWGAGLTGSHSGSLGGPVTWVVLDLLCLGVALRCWLHLPVGELAWRDPSSAGWRWCAERAPESVEIRLLNVLQVGPLGCWLHVQEASGAKLWLWLEPGRDPEHWRALGRALLARAT